MKNQYVGDEKDFLTYGLLRTLARAAGLSLGVAWMLTPDAPNGEGEQRTYLTEAQRPRWQGCDPELYAQMLQVPAQGRSVELIRENGILPNASYFSALTPKKTTERMTYFQELFEQFKGCELLFFDPDIGMETTGTPRSENRSPQHLYWDEVEQAYRRGHSVLIFQHFPRIPHKEYLEKQGRALANHLRLAQVEWFESAQIVFFLAARPEHSAALAKLPPLVQAQWGEHFHHGLVSLPDTLEPAPVAGGLQLAVLPGRFAVCRLGADAPLPDWAGGTFVSFTRAPGELSIICEEGVVPREVQAERGWRILQVAGPLDFTTTGVVLRLAAPLAQALISIFACSTYDTDYLLLKEKDLDAAIRTLQAAGHHFPALDH